MKKYKTQLIIDELQDNFISNILLYISEPNADIKAENIFYKILDDFWKEKIYLKLKTKKDISIYLKPKMKEMALLNEKIKFSIHSNKY